MGNSVLLALDKVLDSFATSESNTPCIIDCTNSNSFLLNTGIRFSKLFQNSKIVLIYDSLDKSFIRNYKTIAEFALTAIEKHPGVRMAVMDCGMVGHCHFHQFHRLASVVNNKNGDSDNPGQVYLLTNPCTCVEECLQFLASDVETEVSRGVQIDELSAYQVNDCAECCFKTNARFEMEFVHYGDGDLPNPYKKFKRPGPKPILITLSILCQGYLLAERLGKQSLFSPDIMTTIANEIFGEEFSSLSEAAQTEWIEHDRTVIYDYERKQSIRDFVQVDQLIQAIVNGKGFTRKEVADAQYYLMSLLNYMAKISNDIEKFHQIP